MVFVPAACSWCIIHAGEAAASGVTVGATQAAAGRSGLGGGGVRRPRRLPRLRTVLRQRRHWRRRLHVGLRDKLRSRLLLLLPLLPSLLGLLMLQVQRWRLDLRCRLHRPLLLLLRRRRRRRRCLP